MKAGPILAGDLLHLDRAASVQFCRPITVRFIREITDRQTFDGWAWIEAYELNAGGDAIARRKLFVQPAGLRWLNPAVADCGHTARRPRIPA
ncbi:hypothetical protein NMK34_21055 [Micromonospora sp. BRA006-A]|uniref:hypothetical protein n=1 Tax=Micromonospora sp. BRA006-A TaxID=2962860 RepID=UPI0029700A7C|nr:hypothetical protein [Micromonospora sp. BRA006-A]MDW3849100.1 hypothetical protein [Micromonospora sp. BRA006-A]MEE3917874.1 hypothetical protein [Micromonospora sp. BRA006-A]